MHLYLVLSSKSADKQKIKQTLPKKVELNHIYQHFHKNQIRDLFEKLNLKDMICRIQ